VRPRARSAARASSRLKDRPLRQVKELPTSVQRVELWWRKRRLVCLPATRPRRSFLERTTAIPRRSRLTTRLREHLARAIAGSNRAVSEVAAEHGVAWHYGACAAADMAETTRLATAIETWWPTSSSSCNSASPTARTEGLNRVIEQVKRAGGGFAEHGQLPAAHHEPHRRHQSGVNTSWRDHPRQVRRTDWAAMSGHERDRSPAL